jgi:hypothetical protein
VYLPWSRFRFSPRLPAPPTLSYARSALCYRRWKKCLSERHLFSSRACCLVFSFSCSLLGLSAPIEWLAAVLFAVLAYITTLPHSHKLLLPQIVLYYHSVVSMSAEAPLQRSKECFQEMTDKQNRSGQRRGVAEKTKIRAPSRSIVIIIEHPFIKLRYVRKGPSAAVRPHPTPVKPRLRYPMHTGRHPRLEYPASIAHRRKLSQPRARRRLGWACLRSSDFAPHK